MQSASEQVIPDDVRRLVIAGRELCYGDQPPTDLTALDKALEAFASRIPWDEQP